MTKQQLIALLNEEIKKVGDISKFARKHGLPQSTVYNAAKGQQGPSDAIVERLGYRRVERFEPVDDDK